MYPFTEKSHLVDGGRKGFRYELKSLLWGLITGEIVTVAVAPVVVAVVAVVVVAAAATVIAVAIVILVQEVVVAI